MALCVCMFQFKNVHVAVVDKQSILYFYAKRKEKYSFKNSAN